MSHHKRFVKLSYILLQIFLGVSSAPTTTPNSTVTHPLLTVFKQFFDERKNANGTFGNGYKFNPSSCYISSSLKNEIAGYKATVQQIMNATMLGKFKGKAWEELALFVDLFGHRIPGSDVFERAVTFLGERMAEIGMTNLHEEEAKIPVWSRGIEVAMLTNPIELELNIRGLGLSVETPPDGINAEVVIIQSFEQLEELKEKVKGKMVLFNSKDGDAQKHLMFGPSIAGKHGAIAVLCRSPVRQLFSSAVLYDVDSPKVPAAVISREDADKVQRMMERQDVVTIHLRMINQVSSERMSRNIIGDYAGEGDHSNETVLLMSHAGSWDVGEGAQDDGVGVILDLIMIKVFKYLGLKPKRTIRNAVFAAEETGLIGASQWVSKHKDELDHYSAALEADFGCLKASGLLAVGGKEMTCIVNEIMKLFAAETNATLLAKMEAIPTNSVPVHATGVPIVSLIGDDQQSGYFETQHSVMDAMTSVNPDELDKCLAVLASTTYVIADLKQKLPRRET